MPPSLQLGFAQFFHGSVKPILVGEPKTRGNRVSLNLFEYFLAGDPAGPFIPLIAALQMNSDHFPLPEP